MPPKTFTQTPYPKDFNSWFEIKPKLHNKLQTPLVKEREIWWCSVGVNVGNEMDGKNSKTTQKKDYTRPVLIFKKLSHTTFLGIPFTTKNKQGSWFYPLAIKDNESKLVFSQIRSFDTKRLQRRIEQIGGVEFERINKAFINFLKK
jgi:mRNA-degrading endonuclease toxin of MazEF toxin-antitoxin module